MMERFKFFHLPVLVAWLPVLVTWGGGGGVLSVAQAQGTAGTPFFQSYSPAAGEFTVTGTTRIIFETNDAELLDRLRAPRGWLDKLRQATGLSLNIVVGETPDSDDILFSSSSQDADFSALIGSHVLTINRYSSIPIFDSDGRVTSSVTGKFESDIASYIRAEGYKYKAGSSGVNFQYKETEGGFRAFQSLVRLLMKSSEAEYSHRKLPHGEGIDYPVQGKRIVMLDVGRFFLPADQVIGFMEKMSLHKVNVLQMHLNDDADNTGFFRLEGHPEWAPDGKFYTREDWDRMEAAARRYGIEIIPEFNTPGHSSAWVQHNRGLLFFDGWGHNRRSINVNSIGNRTRASEYIAETIMRYRDWFKTDTLHLGGEEAQGNRWGNVILYLNTLIDKLEYDAVDNPRGFKTFQIWSDSGHHVSGFPANAEFTHWLGGPGIVMNQRRRVASNKWYDIDGGATYFVPAGGWLRTGYYPEYAYDSSLLNRHKTWFENGSQYPDGMGIALWNDFTRWALRPEERGLSVVNAGMAHGFAGIGLVSWYGIQQDAAGEPIPYDDLGFETLITVSQEMSSHWLQYRFPYFSGDQAKAILFATAQHELLTDSRNFTSGASNRPRDWMGWDVGDMQRAFQGPASFSSGMFVVELAGEGGAMSGGRTCVDTGVAVSVRTVSACDEDVWSSSISGTGGLHKKGVGKLRLAGANTFQGGLMLESGSIGIVGDGSLGNPTGGAAVTFAGGTLAFDAQFNLPAGRNLAISSGSTGGIDTNGHDISILGNISGTTGRFHKSGAGRLKLMGTKNFAGVDINGGVFEIASDSDLGAASGQLVFAGGTLAFGTQFSLPATRNIRLDTTGAIDTNGHNINILGGISGTGDLIKAGAGTMNLMGTSTYSGATRILAGTLASDVSRIKGDVHAASGAILVLSQTADGEYDGDFFGEGTIRKTGSHVLTLKGSSAASWELTEGTVEGEQDFGGDIRFTGSGTRTFNFAKRGDSTYEGRLLGDGNVVKSGSGALVLNADSSSFAGQFNVRSGTVFVDGVLGGNVNVEMDGVLGGGGLVKGDVAVASGGTFMPSRGVRHRLIVEGDLDLDGKYEVVFGLGSIVRGQADISAGSAIVLNRLPPLSFTANDRSKFNILVAEGGLTGEFTGVVHDNLPFLEVTVTYDSNKVEIRGGRNDQDLSELINEDPLEPIVLEEREEEEIRFRIAPGTPQINNNKVLLAEIIDQAEANESEQIEYISGLIAVLADDPEDMPNGKTAQEKLEEGLDSLSAEVHASSKSALIINSSNLRSAAIVQTRAASGAPGSEAAQNSRFNLRRKQWGFIDPDQDGTALWIKTLGTKGVNQGEQEYKDIKYKGGSLLIGGDGVILGTRIGFFGGVSNLDFSQDTGTRNVTAGGVDKSRHFGMYGGASSNRFMLRGGLAYTIHDVATDRTAIMGDAEIKLAGEYAAKTYGAFGELGYQIETQNVLFEPFIGVNYTRHKVEQFEEASPDGAVKFDIKEQSTLMGILELGIHVARDLSEFSPNARARGMLSWNVSLKDPNIIVPQSIGNSQTVDVRGIPLSADGFALEAGLDFGISENVNLSMNCGYSKLTATSSNEKYSFEGKLTYRF